MVIEAIPETKERVFNVQSNNSELKKKFIVKLTYLNLNIFISASYIIDTKIYRLYRNIFSFKINEMNLFWA